MRGLIVRFVVAMLALACRFELARAVPQGGYTDQQCDEHGIRFPRPRSYEEIPTAPSERWVVLRFAEEKERAKRAGRKVAPEIAIVRIDWVADPAPTTPGVEPAPDEGSGDGEGEHAAAPELPLSSFERYLERELKGWSATELAQGKQRDDWSATEYALDLAPGKAKGRTGWAYVWRKARARTIAVVGFSAEQDREAESRIWRTLASGMKFFEPTGLEDSRERAKLERHYERRQYLDPEYRIRVRLALAEGWEAEDTANYIVIYSTRDQPLVRKVLRDLELIRAEYEKRFPPAAPVRAVSTVRICRDEDEYLKFGGWPGSAGYWNDEEEELVLYDATVRRKGKPTEKEDTFIVLFHEAFHQFIHYSVGELAPHSWFNEGYGDYFSGAVIDGGRVRRIGPNPWRLEFIRDTVQGDEHVSWKEIVHYEQAEYYANPYVCYAQGWSMIYFLATSKEVSSNPAWSRILPTYFEELKLAWSEEQKGFAAGEAAADEAAHAEAQKRARVRAVDAAFAGVDLDEIQRAWESFVLALEGSER